MGSSSAGEVVVVSRVRLGVSWWEAQENISVELYIGGMSELNTQDYLE